MMPPVDIDYQREPLATLWHYYLGNTTAEGRVVAITTDPHSSSSVGDMFIWSSVLPQ